MALVTTMGSKSADSFCTVAEADAYMAAAPIDDTAWLALSTAEKEFRLKLAALTMRERLSWAGYEVYENQALPFPRWIEDTDTVEIPAAIKQAQALIAYSVIHRGLVGLTNPADGDAVDQEVTSVSVFGLSFSLSPSVAMGDKSSLGTLTKSEYFYIYLLLDPYITTIVCTPGPTGPTKLDEVA